jgi:hypothetical protein
MAKDLKWTGGEAELISQICQGRPDLFYVLIERTAVGELLCDPLM